MDEGSSVVEDGHSHASLCDRQWNRVSSSLAKSFSELSSVDFTVSEIDLHLIRILIHGVFFFF